MLELWSGGRDPVRERSIPSGGPIDGSGERQREAILVVDDDVSILDTVSAILAQEGYRVVSAMTGEEALAAVTRAKPSLILLDMRMPGMDGWAVARALRERGSTVPIVVMTAAENAARWADEVGAPGYLAKPFGLDDLLATVERYRDAEGRSN